jgi:hypothetical protein
MKKQIFIIMALLVVLTLACNLSTNSPASPTQSQSQPVEIVPSGESQPSGQDQPTTNPSSPQVAPTVVSQPVSIKEGLASLNSYKLSVSLVTSSEPDPKSSTSIVIDVQHSSDQDATYTHMTNTSQNNAEEPDVSENNIYTIGNDQCSGSKEDWDWQSIAANQKEMQDLMVDMFSITPVIENPQFVGEETINNIPSNHFTFMVSGLGVKSGAEVTANQGEYWLAIDGRYIVRYTLVTETRGGPNSQIIHLEAHIELTDINQPVSIAFPQLCIDAKNATPTPEP